MRTRLVLLQDSVPLLRGPEPSVLRPLLLLERPRRDQLQRLQFAQAMRLPSAAVPQDILVPGRANRLARDVKARPRACALLQPRAKFVRALRVLADLRLDSRSAPAGLDLARRRSAAKDRVPQERQAYRRPSLGSRSMLANRLPHAAGP